MQTMNPIHFGKLTVHEKTLESSLGTEATRVKSQFRQARKLNADALQKLDKAGVDIVIVGVPDSQQPTIWSYLLNKKREVISVTALEASETPLNILNNAIVDGFQRTSIEKATLTSEAPAIPIVKLEDGKLVLTGESQISGLTRQGKLKTIKRIPSEA